MSALNKDLDEEKAAHQQAIIERVSSQTNGMEHATKKHRTKKDLSNIKISEFQLVTCRPRLSVACLYWKIMCKFCAELPTRI